VLRDAVNKLAIADCLQSLAQVALQENYVRPEFTDSDCLEIIDGRHPMIEAYSDNPYVANSINMGGLGAKNKIITGPNMGGCAVHFHGYPALFNFGNFAGRVLVSG